MSLKEPGKREKSKPWAVLLENLVLYLIQNTQQKQKTRIYFIHER